MTRHGKSARLLSWERQSEVPLLLLALAFLVAYAWPVVDPGLDSGVEASLTVASWTVWAAFTLDFIIRVCLSTQRRAFVITHWYDVALIVLPMLRPLRLLRVLAFASVLSRTALKGLAGRVAIYVVGTAVASVGLGALAVLDAERASPNSNIQTIGDALWWASVTVTTVGYGDFYPVTTTGRLVAVGLMVVGIAVVGALTGSVATWLISAVQVEKAEQEQP